MILILVDNVPPVEVVCTQGAIAMSELLTNMAHDDDDRVNLGKLTTEDMEFFETLADLTATVPFRRVKEGGYIAFYKNSTFASCGLQQEYADLVDAVPVKILQRLINRAAYLLNDVALDVLCLKIAHLIMTDPDVLGAESETATDDVAAVRMAYAMHMDM